MGFYTIVAAIYGAICYLFIRLFAFLLLLSTRAFLHLGLWMPGASEQTDKLTAIWPQPQFMNLSGTPVAASLNWSESIAALIIRLAVLLVVGMVVSFVISFFFSANTIIYALMRKLVDDTPLENVHTHLDEVKNGSCAKKLMSEDNLLT
jgi:small-conductance mechanosensitive channel